MDVTKFRHTETIAVAAPPEAVYDLISDITRMGEWSPVCTGGTWDDEAHESFTGTNAAGEATWETKCRVDVAERGTEFTFTNRGLDGGADMVRWSYTISPTADGCEVTESWEVLPEYEDQMLKILPDMDVEQYLDGTVLPNTPKGMAETLASLKAVAEA